MFAASRKTAVVAAGNPLTAEAGAAILRRGGNAVDAAIAAGLAAFVAEPLLASAGGAGMMVVSSSDGDEQVVDFFSPVPGLGGAPARRDFLPLEIDFGAACQVFHVGRGSAAPPMALQGMAEASRRFGRLPLEALIGPACDLAVHGATVSPESANVFALLWPINQLSADTMAAYSETDAPPRPGTRHPMPGMVRVLEAFAHHGGLPPELEEAILRGFGVDVGGCITPEDLRHPVRVVEPRTFELGGWRVMTSPRVGGELVRVIVSCLAGEPAPTYPEEVRRVAEACREGHRAQVRYTDSLLGSTTHISVLDAEGNAASVTLTNGEGCGHLIPGTPIQLNNFLGEEDLNPAGFFRYPPGTPLPSAIAPTVARGTGGVLALGSGGANRIRSVVSQVLYRVVMGGEGLEEAVLAPRVHAEEDTVWLEMAERPEPAETLHALHASFANVYEFPTRAFFFGGVHAALGLDGEVDAVGDPRRGGCVVRVEG